ncbi:exosome complex component MTR3-like [Diorhabda carinulata]|uniref:exosome complex component MTR3-like n=1 Tax=Diorhabda carinulata TaxID=1163345 RepID=UPI0025A2B737|nr:exosome complex component MTR3-like [Diorhabda carinulata]
MPVDHKRINGPDETLPYNLFAKSNKKSSLQEYEEIVKNRKRGDSRSYLEHRKLFIKTGVVSQAKGSAYIELGKTKVIVSVFDPREIPNRTEYSLKGEIYCEFKFAPFSCKKRRLHQQDAEEKQYSAIMKQALESTVCRHEFPNFQVDVYALVLHNDGSSLSAAITAAGLALSQAGVPMYDLITSTTLALQKDTILLDPTMKEQNICYYPIHKQNDHGVIIISKLHSHNQISQFYQTGSISLHKLSEAFEILNKSCEEIVPLVQKCLVKHVINNLKNSEVSDK